MHKMYLHYISLPQGFGEKEPFRYFDSNRLVGGGGGGGGGGGTRLLLTICQRENFRSCFCFESNSE